MSMLTEIEEAVEALPRREQEKLLRHLSVKLRTPTKPANTTLRKRWPVPPPKVSKAESQRIARRIGEEFGRGSGRAGSDPRHERHFGLVRQRGRPARPLISAGDCAR